MPHCVALAVGDIAVVAAVTLVLVVLAFVVLCPPFFLFLWRPWRRRQLHRERVEYLGRWLGEELDPARVARRLTRGQAHHLHLHIGSTHLRQ